MSGCIWGLAGSVSTQGPAGVQVISGDSLGVQRCQGTLGDHLGIGGACVREHWGPSGGLGPSGVWGCQGCIGASRECRYLGQQGYRWHQGGIWGVGVSGSHWGCKGALEVAGGLGA